MGVAAAGGGGGGSAGLEEVLGSFRGTAEGWLRLAHRQAQQRVRSGCCATPGTNHDAAETMLSGRRVGVVRIVYWVCEAHGSGTAWWCRVGCAVQCSVQRAVQCLLCCLSQLGRIDSAPSVGMAWKRACALKWGVERGGVAITVGGEELAAVVIEEVWVQSRSLQLRSLSSRCTNCRRLDRDVPSRLPSLPCLQRKSNSQQSSPSFSATQSRVSSLPSSKPH
jgi:hypothetical protein